MGTHIGSPDALSDPRKTGRRISIIISLQHMNGKGSTRRESTQDINDKPNISRSLPPQNSTIRAETIPPDLRLRTKARSVTTRAWDEILEEAKQKEHEAKLTLALAHILKETHLKKRAELNAQDFHTLLPSEERTSSSTGSRAENCAKRECEFYLYSDASAVSMINQNPGINNLEQSACPRDNSGIETAKTLDLASLPTTAPLMFFSFLATQSHFIRP